MLRSLPLPLRLPLIVTLLLLSTLLHSTVLLGVALLKALLPRGRLRAATSSLLVRIAERWISFNSGMIDRFTRTRMELDLPATLDPDRNYLVLCNHQSWVDIPVLQYVFNRRIPFLRFFLKSQLVWVPMLGLAWWALDFPFMKRYSKERLARHPELVGTDNEATRRACEKFREIPVSVMNFIEGTRFTAERHARQASPYDHLLRPRAGGTAFVLDAMAGSIHSLLDVSIVYPGGKPTLLDLLCDRIPQVLVQVQECKIPVDMLRGDYERDPSHRAALQRWINRLWAAKDERVGALLRAHARDGA